MRNIFAVSDTHYDHPNFLKFRDDAGNLIRGSKFSCVEEMNEYMIEKHNSVVTSDSDVVYHLGDVTFDPKNYGRIAKRLRGRMRLLVGNHDDVKNLELTRWFQKIGVWRMFRDENIVLSHFPMRKDQFAWKVDYNGHGHIHQSLIRLPWWRRLLRERNPHINLCVEHHDYTPVSLDQIRAMMR